MRLPSLQRRSVAKEVSLRLAHDRDFAAALPPQANGERAIMVVVPSDRIDVVLARGEDIGYPLTLAVRIDGQLYTFTLNPVWVPRSVHPTKAAER